MQEAHVEINQGELKLVFDQAKGGKLSLADFGVREQKLHIDGGNLRIVIELGQFPNHHFFKVPTIEIAYHEKLGETYWQVEYNGEMVVEKTDKSGNATLMLLNRKKLDELTHHHNNTLIIRGDLPAEVTLSSEDTWFNILEPKTH